MANVQTIDKYEIIQVLGRGAFGIVYLARDLDLKRQVALKVLYPTHSDPSFIERFQREAETAAGFNDPHIVTVYGAGEDGGRHYLVMAYLEGPTMAERVKSGPLLVETALALIAQAAAALDLLHRKGLTHRDVKSSNLILTDAGRRVVLLDFGLVRAAEGTSLTRTDSTLGTPEYMAPEQIEPAAYGHPGPAADIYALGVVAFEVLTGQRPFTADSPLQVMYKHAHADPPCPSSVNPDLPPSLDGPLLKALAKQPSARYLTASDFATALHTAWQAEQQVVHLQALYQQLQTAYQHQHWTEVLELGGQIKGINPAYRNVTDLMAAVRRQLQAPLPSPEGQPADGPPRWIWGIVGGLILLACLVGLAMYETDSFILVPPTPTLSNEITETTATPTATTASASLTATPTVTAHLSPAFTPTDTSIPPTHTPIPALSLGTTRVREPDGMIMVYVPAGNFTMGSDTGPSDEKPPHPVTLNAFWLDRTEVTNAQYQHCVNTGKCQASVYADDPSWNGADYPVVGVAWQDASNYCRWVGGRLPTEAEWEYAARGPENWVYPWGNEFDLTKVNIDGKDDGFEYSAPVGSYPAGASWVGARDLAGNIWEWVNDWYGNNYYANSPTKNPTGPDTGTYRVLRGGSWNDSNEDNVRAANRRHYDPNSRVSNFGIRCIASPGI